MLVLTREQDQVIVIGEGAEKIRVLIVEIRGDKVRVGVEAPRWIPIDRAEVREYKEAAR